MVRIIHTCMLLFEHTVYIPCCFHSGIFCSEHHICSMLYDMYYKYDGPVYLPINTSIPFMAYKVHVYYDVCYDDDDDGTRFRCYYRYSGRMFTTVVCILNGSSDMGRMSIAQRKYRGEMGNRANFKQTCVPWSDTHPLKQLSINIYRNIA